MKPLIYSVISFVLTTTWFQYLRIEDALFNTGIIGVVIFSMLFSSKDGLIFGVTYGLLQSIFTSHVLGVDSAIYAIIVYLIYMVSINILEENYVAPFIISFGSSITYILIFYIFIFLLQIAPPLENIRTKLVIEIIYTTLVTTGLYFMLFKVVKGRKIGELDV